MKLNKFIYDPNHSGGKAVIDATKGSFRFTTGAQGGAATHQIKTPYGTRHSRLTCTEVTGASLCGCQMRHSGRFVSAAALIASCPPASPSPWKMENRKRSGPRGNPDAPPVDQKTS